MAQKIVIDKDILGWADEHAEKLLKEYDEILKVGKHPDLPQRSIDDTIASYCVKNNCHLLTGDSTAYTHYFDSGARTIQIIRYDWDVKGDKPIYLIKVVD
jgi:hypothetical protein